MTKKRIKSAILISTLLFAVAVMMLPVPVAAQCEDVSIGGVCLPASCRCGDEVCGEFDDTEGKSCGGEGEGTCQDESGTIRCIRNEAEAADIGTTAGITAAPLQIRELPNPLGDVNNLQVAIGKVITIFTGIAGSVALLMFVYGGVLLLISGGSEQRVTAGKQAITWATIGLFVIFGSYAILRVIFLALGAQL